LAADFGYAGYYVHAPSGLNLTLFRAYDPDIGRWINRDPMGEAGGLNLYDYVGNSPFDWRDPMGLVFRPPRNPNNSPRWPDYYQLNLGIPTGTPVTWTPSYSIDRYGNQYGSLLSFGAGRPAGSCSLTANWLDRSSTPSEDDLYSFLTALGLTVGAGFFVGGSESYTPGSGWATGVGFFTPQFGGGVSYSFWGGPFSNTTQPSEVDWGGLPTGYLP
jgi:RHS repeat-associated protein